MLKKIELQDGFYKWVDKINLMVDDVDRKFKIENADDIGQTLSVDVAGGTVKIGVSDYIVIPPATVILPETQQSVVGVDLNDNTLKYFPYSAAPTNKFLAIYFINTNTVGVSSVQDMRTWATNLDAVTNELLDEIGDQFLGNYESDPTVDNDGNALITGACYYNTVENVLKFYNGTAWFSPQKIATNAANSATTSASAASTSETNAATSASNAEVSETNASNSAISALDSKNLAVSAKDSAVSAKDQAEALFNQFGDQYLGSKSDEPTVDNSGNPLDEGDIYWNSVDNVLKFYTGTKWVAPENIATTAASEAQSSASAASTSETNAATSASNAATSETNTANLYDLFDDRFLGSKSTDPTTDNDGNALVNGAAYFNSTDNTIKYYDGTAWFSPQVISTDAASAASTSASNAQTAETNTVNLYDLFDDRFLGAKASNPTTDNDGDVLAVGSIYYNTTTKDVRFYTSTGWISPQTISTNAADNAASSASAASTSASNASTSATNASNSASAAATSESNAATSATNASDSASAASTSATNASNSASAAATSETNAATSASNASTSASNAATSENKAFLWAEQDQNIEVETGKYSAKHWASVAESSATGQLTYRGNFDASLGSYPSSPELGDYYKVTTGGTVDGRSLVVGDFIFYNGGTATASSGWNHIKDRDTTYIAGNGISLSSTTFSVAGGDGLTQQTSGLAVDSTVIRTTGNQTISGVKTHNDDVVMNDAATSYKSGTEGCKVQYNATSKSLEYNFF